MCSNEKLNELKETSEAKKDETVIQLKSIRIKISSNENTKIRTPLTKLSSAQMVEELKEANGVACEMCQLVLTAARYLVENKVEQVS